MPEPKKLLASLIAASVAVSSLPLSALGQTFSARSAPGATSVPPALAPAAAGTLSSDISGTELATPALDAPPAPLTVAPLTATGQSPVRAAPAAALAPEAALVAPAIEETPRSVSHEAARGEPSSAAAEPAPVAAVLEGLGRELDREAGDPAISPTETSQTISHAMDGARARLEDRGAVLAGASDARADGGLASADAPAPSRHDHLADVEREQVEAALKDDPIFFRRSQKHVYAIARFLLLPPTRLLFRLRGFGFENVPKTGPALLVGNHPSYVDPLWLGAIFADRPIRFLMYRDYYENWKIKWLMRILGIIPVAEIQEKGQVAEDGSVIEKSNGPRAILGSLALAREALRRGEVVAIFGEGKVTRNGSLSPFKRGLSFIVRGLDDVPVIPFHLDGPWGGPFSKRQRLPWRYRLQLFPRLIQLRLGKPLEKPTPQAAREAVEVLGADNMRSRIKSRGLTLARAFLRAAKWNWRRQAVADPLMGELSYGKLLTAGILFSRLLAPILGDQKNVGMLLPPSVAAVSANVGLGIMGKVPVNLNYVASPEDMAHSVRKAGLKTILTSRKVLERFPFDFGPDVKVLFVEDFRKDVSERTKKALYLALRVMPAWLIERIFLRKAARSLEETAAILFTSGSEDLPKGVELSHLNVLAEIEMMREVSPVDQDQVLLGVLPFFHSFGFSTNLWFMLLNGMHAVHVPDPLKFKTLEEMAKKFKATLLFATPTFLKKYLKWVAKEAFATLELVRTGGEDLPETLAQDFSAKFGPFPLQGFGTTELVGGVTANHEDKPFQKGTKKGSVGVVLPGAAARVVDPETFEPLPYGSEGMLLIYGANVMKGYLGDEAATKRAKHEGWYITGDKAVIQKDGFIEIKGRYKDFTKVGAEMVSNASVAKALNEASDVEGAAFGVTGVPDPSEDSGEKLVVLYSGYPPERIPELLARLRERGVPNIRIPKPRNFLLVPELPWLGSQKLNLKKLKEMALAAFPPGASR